MNPTQENPKIAAPLTWGYTICLVGTVLWSSTAIFIRYLTETYQLPALVLAFWRDAFVFLALGAFFLIRSRRRLSAGRKNLGFLFAYGVVLALFNATWTISVAENGAAVATVLAYSSAAFTALLGWRLFGERLGPVKIIAVTLSLAGCVLVSGAYYPAAWQVNPLGVASGLLSGLAFASYSLMGRAASHRGLYPWTTLLYAFGFAAVFLLAYNLFPAAGGFSNLFWLGNSGTGWAVLFILAVGPTIGGYGLYTVSLGYLPASVANLIATLEPAFTAALAYLFLGERLTPAQWSGSVLILAGVLALRLRDEQLLRRRPAVKPGG